MRSSAFRKRFSSAPAFDFMDWARSSRAGETAAVLSLDSAAGKTDDAGRWTAADQRPAQVGSRQRQNLDSRKMLIHSSVSKPTRGGRGMEHKKNRSADIGRLCCFEAEDKFLRDSLPHYCFTACFPDRRPSVHQRPIGSLRDSG